jgi:hypothetical protein
MVRGFAMATVYVDRRLGCNPGFAKVPMCTYNALVPGNFALEQRKGEPMASESSTSLHATVGQHENAVLSEWIEQQRAAFTLRSDLLNEPSIEVSDDGPGVAGLLMKQGISRESALTTIDAAINSRVGA